MNRCYYCPVEADGHCPGRNARRLCDLIDPGHPDFRPGYRASIADHARAAPPGPDRPAVAVAEAVAGLAAVRRCPYRSIGPGCGCSGARCGLRSGALVSHLDCFPCARSYDRE